MSISLRERAALVSSRWAGLLAFGVLEQGILTGINFGLTAAMGHWLGALNFGWLSIAMVLLQFLEAASMGLFGDAVPSVAHRLPLSARTRFRGAFLTISCAYSTVIMLCLCAAWPLAAALGASNAELIPATGLALVGLRAQNAVRRLYYLEDLRREAALAALINALAMLAGVFILVFVLASRNPAHVMVCIALANGAAALMVFLQHGSVPLARPTGRMLRWTSRRLWRTGRWLLASNAMSWLGNLGPVILVGAIAGVAASGTLRVVMTLLVPPAQMVIVFVSLIIPKLAQKPKEELVTRQWPIALQTMSLIGLSSGVYALVMTAAGGWLPRLVFGEPAAGITQLTVAIATFGYALEAIRYGCNVVLLARGDAKIITIGQVIALISAITLIPFASYFGLNAIIFAGTLSNNLNTIFVFLCFFSFSNAKIKISRKLYI